MTRSVIVFLLRNNQVCLGKKKTGHGQGKWNGFGGHREENESAEEAAVRELFEESRVRASKESLNKMAELDYKEENEWLIDVFTVSDFAGEPKASSEMEPKWFPIVNLPLEDMWPNDEKWLPKVLRGRKFKATFWHDKAGRLLKHEFSPLK